MNVEDIKKLTVADLKKELKARNLHVTGNKSELMQRLTEHILNSEERQILDTSGNVDESLLEGIHEDEVLGLSGASFYTAPSDSPAVTKLPVSEQRLASKKIISTPLTRTSKLDAASKEISSAKVVPTEPVDNAEKNDSNSEKDPEKEEPVAKKIHLKSPSIDDDTKPKIDPKVSAADPTEQRIERAKKFNLPLSDNDRKNLRAQRFGMAVSNGGSKTGAATSIASGSVSLDPEVLMKRAQRFGLPVVKTSKDSVVTNSDNGGKLQHRAERFGLDKQQATSGKVAVVGEDNEALTKRKLRFSGGDTDEKKKARADRFGLANK